MTAIVSYPIACYLACRKFTSSLASYLDAYCQAGLVHCNFRADVLREQRSAQLWAQRLPLTSAEAPGVGVASFLGDTAATAKTSFYFVGALPKTLAMKLLVLGVAATGRHQRLERV